MPRLLVAYVKFRLTGVPRCSCVGAPAFMSFKCKRDREEACYICGHYHDYEGGEPCTICGHVMVKQDKRNQQDSVLPTAIIPAFLYLGSYDTASRAELLKAMSITHILNTVPDCQPLYKNTFTYHTVSCAPPSFEECFAFIDSAQQQGSKVLVYCMSGASRSPTIVIGYLMKLRGWRLAECYKWVKEKRPNLNIKAGDTRRLMELEMQIHGSCSVPHGFELSHSQVVEASQQHIIASTSTQAMFQAGGFQQPGPFSESNWSVTPSCGPAGSFGFQPPATIPFVFGGATPGSVVPGNFNQSQNEMET